MLQYLAQVADMALEDAIEIARCMANEPDISTALPSIATTDTYAPAASN